MHGGRFHFANSNNLQFIESLYQSYLSNPESVDPSWRYFFEGMQFSSSSLPSAPLPSQMSPDLRVHLLIEAYRKYGHLLARFNPLGAAPKEPEELHLENLWFKKEE